MSKLDQLRAMREESHDKSSRGTAKLPPSGGAAGAALRRLRPSVVVRLLRTRTQHWTATKPWEAEGMSRATWYGRQKK